MAHIARSYLAGAKNKVEYRMTTMQSRYATTQEMVESGPLDYAVGPARQPIDDTAMKGDFSTQCIAANVGCSVRLFLTAFTFLWA